MLRFRFFPSTLRFIALSALAVLSFAGVSFTHAQSLRFAPPIFRVNSATGTNNAVNLLHNPAGIAVDAAGDLFIADTTNQVIKKVSPTQTTSIYAGTGAFGNTGDGGPASSAVIGNPAAVAVDASGNVFFTEPQFFVVRKIDVNGVITRFAGGNGSGSSGDGGSALSAQITPGGIAVDTLGNLYIVDTTSNTVRVVDALGNINPYAGGGTVSGAAANGGPALSAQFSSLNSIAADFAGNIYIGDFGTHDVRRIDSAGILHAFAGTSGVSGSTGNGGQATAAKLAFPYGIAADPAGNVYITDQSTVRMVNTSGVISNFAGTGNNNLVFDGIPADHASIYPPTAVAADNFGNLYVTVPQTNSVYQVILHPEVFPQTKVGASSVVHRLILENNGVSNIVLSSFSYSGDFHVSNPIFLAGAQPCQQTSTIGNGFNNWCTFDVIYTPTAEGIRSFPLTVNSNDTPGTLIQTLSSTGLAPALPQTSGQMFIVAGGPNLTTNPTALSGPSQTIGLQGPSGVAVDKFGNIFLSEPLYCQIRRVDGNTGNMTLFAGKQDPKNCDGVATPVSGDGGSALLADVNGVANLVFDANGNLFLSDVWDGRIRMIDPSGVIHAVAGKDVGSGNTSGSGYSGDGGPATNAELYAPLGMAFDKLGNLFIADSYNNVIRKIDTSGFISTVAGNHSLGAGYSGDFGLATNARLNQPTGVAVDAAGNIYIADYQNSVIREVVASSGNIGTIAGKAGVYDYTGDGGTAGKALLNHPYGLSIDAAGNLFITDRSNFVVRKIDTNRIITTVAGNQIGFDGYNSYNGDGLFANASNLYFPDNTTISPAGFLFVADTLRQVVQQVSPNGALGFGPQSVNTTSTPQSLTVTNIGNTPLHFDSQAPTGITGDFALAPGGTCNFSSTLNPGTSCSVNITFTPTAAGGRNGVFAFYSDGIASPGYTALSGTGTQAGPQKITFAPIADQVYGNDPITLSATATSGQPVTFSIKSGSGSVTLSGNTVTIKAVGAVTIAADQAGNGSFNPAPQVTRSFNITPATLYVAPNAATSVKGQPLVPLSYFFGNLEYNDTLSVVTGVPTLSTAATPSSVAGQYLINMTTGTLHAANYNIQAFDGVYTITNPVAVTPTIIISEITSYGRMPDGGYIAYITIKNSGNSTAPAVVLQSVKVAGVTGNPANLAVGNIAAGASVMVQIGFGTGIGSPGTAVIQTITGKYTGGTFGGNVHITLP